MYTNKNIIPNYESLELKNNKKQIYNNWNLFLDWYHLNNFQTSIIIHDNLLFSDIDFCVQIFQLLKEKKINQKIIFYLDLYKLDDFQIVLKNINKLNEFKIEYIFNIVYDQIESFLTYDFSFINYKINLLIPPQLDGDYLIHIQTLINNNNLNIKEYIEIDSDQWTEESILEYLKYINYLLLNIKDINEIFNTNLPISLNDQHILDNNDCKKNCFFQKSLNILLVDLSINLCHKFQYDDLIIGYLIPDQTKDIFSFKAKNLPTVILGTHLKRSSTPHCEKCSFINVCKGFCFTRSYLKCYNPIIPIEESCNLKKIKFAYIFKFLKNNKILLNKISKEKISSLHYKYVYDIIDQIGD